LNKESISTSISIVVLLCQCSSFHFKTCVHYEGGGKGGGDELFDSVLFMNYRILVADDHPLFRVAIKQIISVQLDNSAIGETDSMRIGVA